MAEITVQRTGELLRGVFRILRENSSALPAAEVLSRLERIVPPTEFEQSEYPNRPGVRRYERIVRFSTIQCVKAGWLVKNQGLWNLTDLGKEAYDRYTNPVTFKREAQKGFKKWEREHSSEEEDSEEAEASEQAPAYGALEEAEEKAWLEIKAHIAEMDPFDFQQVVAGLFRGMGYHVVWVSPPGRDGNNDAIAYSDSLGVTGPRIRIEVKRQTRRQDVDEIRSFLGILHDNEVGIYVATGGFTSEAEKLSRQDKRRVMLLDLEKFVNLWRENYSKIPEPERGLLPLKPVYFLVPRGPERSVT